MPTRRRQIVRGSSSSKSSPKWTEEQDIDGHIYNHPKLDEGYNDDNVYAEPYRHIRNWFLSKPEAIDRMRIPFPKNARKFDNVSLYGELEPSIEKDDKPNAKVVISDIQYWMVDRHREDRGAWILSNGAWYRLKQPCKEAVKQSNGKRVSQHELHQSFHAKISLLSNIIDMMSDSRGYIQPTLVSFHAQLSPEESYHSLRLSEIETSNHPNIVKEPFDLNLLKHDPEFIMNNLLNLDTVLSKKCKFIQGLKRLQREKSKSKRKANSFDYETSIKASNERCNRWPWGEQKMDYSGDWSNSIVALSNLKLHMLLQRNNVILTNPLNDLKEERKNESTHSEEDKILEPIEEKNESILLQKILLDEGEDISVHSIKDTISPTSPDLAKANLEYSLSVDTDTDSDCDSATKASANHEKVHHELTHDTFVENAKQRLQEYFGTNTQSINKDKISALTKDIIYDEVFPPEVLLDCINALQKSSTGARKSLFDSSNSANSGVKGIFVLWLDRMLETIVNRPYQSEGIEEKVIASILKLLLSFTFIKKASQITKIVELFDVDLPNCVEKVKGVSNQFGNKDLIEICNSAYAFLSDVITKSDEQKKTQNTSNEENLSSPTSEKSATPQYLTPETEPLIDLACSPSPQKDEHHVSEHDYRIASEASEVTHDEFSLKRKASHNHQINEQIKQPKLNENDRIYQNSPRKLAPLPSVTLQPKNDQMQSIFSPQSKNTQKEPSFPSQSKNDENQAQLTFISQPEQNQGQSSVFDSNVKRLHYINNLDKKKLLRDNSLYPQMIYGNPQVSNMPFSSSQIYTQNLPLNTLNSSNIMNGIASNHLPLNASLGLDYLNKIHLQSTLHTQNLYNPIPKNHLNQLNQMRNGFPYSKEYLASAQIHNYQKNCDDLLSTNPYLASVRHNQLKQHQLKQHQLKQHQLKQHQINFASYQGGIHLSAGQLNGMNQNLDNHESCDEEEYVNVMM